jgi:hypothetical protein
MFGDIEVAMRRIARWTLTVFAATAILLLGAGAANAVPPEHGSFSFTDSFVDTEVCAAEGFAVNAVQDENVSFEVFFDQDGNFVRTIAHVDLKFTISANGITLHERDKFTVFFYPDGSREVGLWTHIQGPGGIVLRDAGQLVFNADGTLAYTRGPHPQFLGATFCSALTP